MKIELIAKIAGELIPLGKVLLPLVQGIIAAVEEPSTGADGQPLTRAQVQARLDQAIEKARAIQHAYDQESPPQPPPL